MDGRVRQVANKLMHSHRLRVIIFLLIIISIALGLLTVPVESAASGARIKTYADGVWYAATTVTGVGYGDMFPVTPMGRLIGVVLETFGVIMFGSIVAFVSVEILRYEEDFYVRRFLERSDETDKKIDELTKRLDYLVREKK